MERRKNGMRTECQVALGGEDLRVERDIASGVNWGERCFFENVFSPREAEIRLLIH